MLYPLSYSRAGDAVYQGRPAGHRARGRRLAPVDEKAAVSGM
jgi:hypothetical protein